MHHVTLPALQGVEYESRMDHGWIQSLNHPVKVLETASGEQEVY
jgi:hypothetical protein